MISAYHLVKSHKAQQDIRKEKDIFWDEYQVLSKGTIENDEEYAAQAAIIAPELRPFIEQITILKKLTVVDALLGFTRLKPWEAESGQTLAPL